MRYDITVPDELAPRLDARWRKKGFASRSEYLRSLVIKDLNEDFTAVAQATTLRKAQNGTGE